MKFHVYQEFWNDQYHVAAFNAWGSALRSEQQLRLDMRAWCQQTFGKDDTRWKDDITFGEVRFKDEMDLALFLLKWTE